MVGYKVLRITDNKDIAGVSAGCYGYVEYVLNEPAYPYENSALFVFTTLEAAKGFKSLMETLSGKYFEVFACKYEQSKLCIPTVELFNRFDARLPWEIINKKAYIHPHNWTIVPNNTAFAESVTVVRQIHI